MSPFASIAAPSARSSWAVPSRASHSVLQGVAGGGGGGGSTGGGPPASGVSSGGGVPASSPSEGVSCAGQSLLEAFGQSGDVSASASSQPVTHPAHPSAVAIATVRNHRRPCCMKPPSALGGSPCW